MTNQKQLNLKDQEDWFKLNETELSYLNLPTHYPPVTSNVTTYQPLKT